jgi:hypothetical protein
MAETHAPPRVFNETARRRFEAAHNMLSEGDYGSVTTAAGAIVLALEGLCIVIEDNSGALLLEPYGLAR